MQQVTIHWHIYLLTHSAFALGLVGLVRFAPIVVFSLIGGVIADTYDRRRVMLITQSAMMLSATILGLLTYSGWISTGLIYVLVAFTGAGEVFDAPARDSLPPNLVPIGHLTNALSLNNISRHTASIVGPALAGFVIAWKGVAAVYWINAASFLAVLVALVLMRTPTQQELKAAKITLKAFGDGIRFLRRSQVIFSIMLIDLFGVFFSSASALLPIFAREILRVGPKGFGILSSSQAAGAVIAGAGIAFAGNLKKKGPLVLWAFALYGTATALFGMSRWFALSVFFLAMVGAMHTCGAILRNTIRQLVTPDHLRGRMGSLNVVFTRGGFQLGNLEAGIVASLIGVPLTLITGGIATVITVAAVAWLVPQLRNYRD